MSATNTFSIEAPLPESIKSYRAAYIGGDTQHPARNPIHISSPPRYSKSHLARSRSTTPPNAPPSDSPPSSAHSTPPTSRDPSPHSHIPENDLKPSSPLPRSHDSNPPSTEPHHTTPQDTAPLPKSAYNYEPYHPPPSPPVLPWSRTHLHTQTLSRSTPIFLTCNLTNPVHLSSILAHGCAWNVVEEVAAGMTPGELRTADGGEEVVEGVLVGGLVDAARERLEDVFRRRWKGGFERGVREVEIRVRDGGIVGVAAYVYRGVEQ